MENGEHLMTDWLVSLWNPLLTDGISFALGMMDGEAMPRDATPPQIIEII